MGGLEARRGAEGVTWTGQHGGCRAGLRGGGQRVVEQRTWLRGNDVVGVARWLHDGGRLGKWAARLHLWRETKKRYPNPPSSSLF